MYIYTQKLQKENPQPSTKNKKPSLKLYSLVLKCELKHKRLTCQIEDAYAYDMSFT